MVYTILGPQKTDSNTVLPKKVDKYQLDYEIKKVNPYKNYLIGVYKYKNTKYFIKIWMGRKKSFQYYSLLNEYFTGKTFYKIISRENKTKHEKILIPQVLEYFESENSLSVVFEYIDGKILSSFPLDYQAMIIAKVFKFLSEVTKKIKRSEREALAKRDFIFYFLSLPFFTFIAIISNLKAYRIILPAFISCIKNIGSIKNSKIILAHRDLCPDNVLIFNNNIYILDSARMVLTIPEYDFSYLSVYENFKKLCQIITQTTDIRPNEFLKNHIAIQYFNIRDPQTGKRIFGNYLKKFS